MPSPYSFFRAVEIGPWAAQPSVESAGGMGALPRWTAKGCAPAATSTTRPLCGTSPHCYWFQFEKQGHRTSLSRPLSTFLCPSGSSVRSTSCCPGYRPGGLFGMTTTLCTLSGSPPHTRGAQVTSKRVRCGGFADPQTALGPVLDCRQHVTKTSPARWSRHHRLLVVCTFVSLCRRDLLSIFSTTYKFVWSSYRSPTPLWNSVRFELSLFSVT